MVLSVVLVAGCAEPPKTIIGKLPETHTTNLKEQHDYPIVKIQGTVVFYLDDGITKTVFINGWDSRDYDFYIMESNKTYLHYEKYGGVADFYQWTLYIKRGD